MPLFEVSHVRALVAMLLSDILIPAFFLWLKLL